MPVPLLLRHRRRRLLLLLLLALLVASFRGGSSDEAYDTSMCLLQPRTCGGVQIKYPFYLSGESSVVKGSGNSSCGYPGLGILCEDDEKPTIQLGEKYDVKDINYTNLRISLADPDVFKAPSCPRAEHNTTVPPAFWLYLPPENIDYLVFFIGCSFTQSYLGEPSATDQITCPNVGGDPGLSFVLPKDQVPPGNWSLACKQVIEVPVLKSEPFDPKNPRWRDGGYGSVLHKGFQLAWNNSGRPCIQCEGSNGKCGHSQTGGFIGCLCPDGRVNSNNCTSNSTGTLFQSETFFFSAKVACSS